VPHDPISFEGMVRVRELGVELGLEFIIGRMPHNPYPRVLDLKPQRGTCKIQLRSGLGLGLGVLKPQPGGSELGSKTC